MKNSNKSKRMDSSPPGMTAALRSPKAQIPETNPKQQTILFATPQKFFLRGTILNLYVKLTRSNVGLRWTPFRDKVGSKEYVWRPKSTESSIPLLLACRFFILIPKGHQMHFLSSESLSVCNKLAAWILARVNQFERVSGKPLEYVSSRKPNTPKQEDSQMPL
jgi:hypothetical protein